MFLQATLYGVLLQRVSVLMIQLQSHNDAFSTINTVGLCIMKKQLLIAQLSVSNSAAI